MTTQTTDNNTERQTVIISATFNANGKDSAEFVEYAKRAHANSVDHGGVLRNKFFVTENLGEGDAPHFMATIEFPSRDKAKQAFNSDEYEKILPFRNKAFKEVKILLTEQS